MKKRAWLFVIIVVLFCSCSSKEIRTPNWLQGRWNQTNGIEVITVSEDNIVFSSFENVSFNAKAFMSTYENVSVDQKSTNNSYNITIINKNTGMGMTIGFSFDETKEILSVTLGGNTYTYSK